MARLTKERVINIQHLVLDSYRSNKRDLPWRNTEDPYKILVSEIMLQQTQVSRVIPKYQEFLTQFPTVNNLADSSRADVITAWRGLGYNRRALNLQRAAQQVVARYGGQLPHDLASLRSLPGIGRYTAGAIRNFAFGIDTPAVDTNVKQLIDHFVPRKPAPPQPRRSRFAPPSEVLPGRTERGYYELAEQLMPKGRARTWLHAVMDYSALVLRKTRQKTLGSTRGVEPRKSESFIGSNRYLRGRTLDRLRESPQTLDELFLADAAPIEVERERYELLVKTLGTEGFLEQSEDRLQLAES